MATAPNKKAGQGKFTAWSKTMRMEGNGTIQHCVYSMFIMLEQADRAKMLADLQTAHADLSKGKST